MQVQLWRRFMIISPAHPNQTNPKPDPNETGVVGSAEWETILYRNQKSGHRIYHMRDLSTGEKLEERGAAEADWTPPSPLCWMADEN